MVVAAFGFGTVLFIYYYLELGPWLQVLVSIDTNPSSFSMTVRQGMQPNQPKSYTRKRLMFWKGWFRAQTWIYRQIFIYIFCGQTLPGHPKKLKSQGALTKQLKGVHTYANEHFKNILLFLSHLLCEKKCANIDVKRLIVHLININHYYRSYFL